MITNSEFNKKLIDKLREQIPEKGVLVDLLVDYFSLGKEAAYRRLRGDVPFSFTEASVLADRLKISLDDIVGMATSEKKSQYTLLSVPRELKSIEEYGVQYYRVLSETYTETYEYYAGKPSLNILSAFNTVPPSLLYPYPYLSQFRAFKWIYQLYPGRKMGVFMPKSYERRVKEKHELSKKLHSGAELTFIFGREIFIILMKQIQHFYRLRFISDEQLGILKDELYQMVDNLEQVAISGVSDGSRRSWLYLSNLDFENNYTYFSYAGGEEAFMHVYQIYSISTTSEPACWQTKEWILSLMKYSTLISISGEGERLAFFDKQRKCINELEDLSVT